MVRYGRSGLQDDGILLVLLLSTLSLTLCSLWGVAHAQGSTIITASPGEDLSQVIPTDADAVVQLETGVYTFANVINITNGRSITIRGVSKQDTIIDGQGLRKAFAITNGGSLVLSDLTLQNCSSAEGGAIRIEEGSLDGTSVSVRENTSPGVFFDGWAGAILILGDSSTVRFVDSDFTRNSGGVAAAIWLNNGKNTFTRCVFDSNFCFAGGFGGAIVPEGTSVNVFEDCEFRGNYAEFGGAIDDGSTANTLFKNCLFRDNVAIYGGSYYAFASSSATFDGCRFENSTAITTGGAAEISSTTTPVFRNCVFENNRATASADISITGGIYTVITDCKFLRNAKDSNPASGAHIGSQNNFLVRNCEFDDGSAIQGGAIYIRSAKNVTIESSTFNNNSASTKGGAIYIEGFFDENSDPAYIKIRDCSFRNSKATTVGGAISLLGSSNFEIEIENCRLESNEGDSGGAIAVQKDMTLKIDECEFESNKAATGGAISVNDAALVVVRKSNFRSNTARFGAALAQNLGGSFRISDSQITNGEAVFKGGALFAGLTATGCSRFEQVKLEDNEASVAGGAFFFAARSPPSCSTEWKKKKNGGKDNENLNFCYDCKFSNNKGGYGPDYATGASTLKRESDIAKKLSPSESFDMNFLLVDYYDQTLKGFIDTLVNIKVSNGSVLRGETSKQPERDGSVSFTSLRWGVEPGRKARILFYTEPPTTETEYTVEIQNCGSDEVLYEKSEQIDGDNDKTTVWYCLTIQDPDDIAKNLTYAGVAVVLFLSFVFLLLLFWKRQKRPIKNASPVFCYTVVLGVILSAISVSMWTTADNGPCVLRGWLLVLGTSLIFGSLFVREWRLLRIFRNAKVGRKIFTNKDLAIGLALIVAINLVVLIVWTAVAPPYRTEKIKTGSEDEITYECDVSFPSSVFVIILIVLQALLLAFNCIVSFLLRNVPSSFNESKHIAFTVYNSAIMIAVAITLIVVFNDDKTAVLIILALTVLFGCFVTLVVLFAPKIYLSFLKRSELAALIQKETVALQMEMFAREKQMTEIMSSKTTTSEPSSSSA
eukprot:TRINITY_DN2170_c0_g7_i1.p1 TRINITY_DN2170_c0_g7~~TRINITY_DN2170_c0_g7_i1.p1  ORF type:complete len:1056 (+),score=240.70 TRINITY_DN2170_c0_g7_i1:52-3219(+)